MRKVIEFEFDSGIREGHSMFLQLEATLTITQIMEHAGQVLAKKELIYQGSGSSNDSAVDAICKAIEMEYYRPRKHYYNFRIDDDIPWDEWESAPVDIRFNKIPEKWLTKFKDAFLKSNSSKLPAHS